MHTFQLLVLTVPLEDVVGKTHHTSWVTWQCDWKVEVCPVEVVQMLRTLTTSRFEDMGIRGLSQSYGLLQCCFAHQ